MHFAPLQVAAPEQVLDTELRTSATLWSATDVLVMKIVAVNVVMKP